MARRIRSVLLALAPNLALAAATLLVALGAFEGLLRVLWLPQRIRAERGTELRDYSEHDPVLGWRKRAGISLRFVRREYEVAFSTNALGLRDPPRAYEAAADVERVLALGDSYVEGYTVPLEHTVTQRLEAALGAQRCHVEVINGATTGYSTDQEYLFYVHEGRRYSPRVVLLFFYHNDVFFNDSPSFYQGVAKPMFELRQGQLVLAREALPQPSPRLAEPEAEQASERSQLASLQWLRERLWFGAPLLYNRLGALGLWEPNRPIGARLEQRVYSKQRIDRLERAWATTGALLARLADETRAEGRRLLVVYVPARFEVDDAAWRVTIEKYAIREAEWDRGLVRGRLASSTRRAGVPLLDLTPALRAAEGLLRTTYYPYDGHWNARGHHVAAEEIRGWLLRAGWLETCPR
jgi:hypothetical protein